ncbi:MAG: RNA polymerase sigma-70 factor [Prolixibacteraceae bacterium]|nr:RNA polymerase sigma-70 factor [Prolixibacteraceae bacterium]
MNQADDKELYLKLKEGNELAFQILFKKYYSAMCHFARQFLNDSEMAEETVQDMFVKIWEKRESLNIETSVKHYFFRSVRNHCLNQLQHEKIKKQYASKVLETANHEISPEQYFIEVDLIKRIEASIDALPPKRKEIFRLSREQGMKYKDIAETLNISVKTVEAQMGLALKHLRDELKDFSNHLITLFFILKKTNNDNRGNRKL